MIAVVVDGNELDIRILEQPLGAGCEVGKSCSDCDNNISVFRDLVGCGSTCNTDTAQAVRITGLACALSSLALAERNIELCTELLNFFACQ